MKLSSQGKTEIPGTTCSNIASLHGKTYFRFAGSGPHVVVFSGHIPGPGDSHVIIVTTDML